jgi:hypothetical protein
MKINERKTKEMFISFNKDPPEVPNVVVNGIQLERVECVTLLGLKITSNLSWEVHTDYISKKAQKRLYFLTMLRRSKASSKDIVQIYCTKIRPVLEYASPAWHAGLSCEQSDTLEHIQERAMRIAFPGMEYDEALTNANIPRLIERRKTQCKALFAKMQNPGDKLNRILPPPRTKVVNTRSSQKFNPPRFKTERFRKSFLPYVLLNCQ